MLRKRILSSIIGILVLIFFTIWGEFPFFVLSIIVTTLGIGEFYLLLENGEIYSNKYLLIFLSLIFILFAYLNNVGYINLPYGIIIFFIVLVLYINHIINNNYQDILKSIGANLFGLLYIAGGMTFTIYLRNWDIKPFDNTKALWLALIATWAADTGAYFIGKYFGNKKLSPKISPNKTVGGAIGGILFTLIVVLAISEIYNVFSFYWLIYGVFIAILAITGDLLESCLKRDMAVKDSGKIIPGHGGILDRLDSLLFTVPFTYYFLYLFM